MDELRRLVERHREVGSRPILVVPSNQMPLVKRSADRLEVFRGNLERAMAAAEAGDENAGPALVPTTPVPEHTDEPALVIINACITCRGACCAHGGDEAYLDAKFLASRLEAEPDRAPASIVAEYLELVPDESIEGSCIFHGTQGCVLSRQVRSKTCNEFLCYPLQEHRQAAHSLAVSSVAVAKDGERFLRAGWMEPDGSRTEMELDQSGQN